LAYRVVALPYIEAVVQQQRRLDDGLHVAGAVGIHAVPLSLDSVHSETLRTLGKQRKPARLGGNLQRQFTPCLRNGHCVAVIAAVPPVVNDRLFNNART
jgi:hypothetical protein